MSISVSVVVPTYNRESTIKRAVQSIIAQTFPVSEIIIVDDCSIDKTLKEVLSIECEKIKLIRLEVHSGANVARNKGIEVSNGNYIAFQDSDDEWMPDKLEKQIEYMKKNNYQACYCAFYLFENNQISVFPEDYFNNEKYENGILKELSQRNVVSTQTLVVSREVIEQVGVFDEEMPRLQDYEYAIRICGKFQFGYIAEPLVKLYRMQNSISYNQEARLNAMQLLLKKHWNFLDVEHILDLYFDNAHVLGDKDSLMKVVRKLENSLPEAKGMCYEFALEYLYNRYKIKDDIIEQYYKIVFKDLKSEEFAIYGAGKIGQNIYRQLLEKKLNPKCFLVSERTDIANIQGIPVRTIYEFEDKTTISVIIGISLSNQLELLQNLQKIGYKKFAIFPQDSL